MMLVAPCPPHGLLHIAVLVPRVSTHELFSASQDIFISPVCQVSLGELFSRISLFHFYNTSSFGQAGNEITHSFNNIIAGCSFPTVFYSLNRQLLSTYYVSNTC